MRVVHVCSNDQDHGLSNRIQAVEYADGKVNSDSDQEVVFFCNNDQVISLHLPFEKVEVK